MISTHGAAQLADFAALGSLMSRLIYGKSNPRVALLSVGSEEGKGNMQVKATTELLRNSSLNFTGNVEPNDLTSGKAEVEVVVCDGFIGNVMLKTAEGAAKMFTGFLKDEYKANIFSKLSASFPPLLIVEPTFMFSVLTSSEKVVNTVPSALKIVDSTIVTGKSAVLPS